MKLTRVAKSRTAVLSHIFEVGETPTDPTSPGCSIVDANGDTVAVGSAAATGGGSGEATATLASQSALSLLTVTWTGTVAGVLVSEVDYVEVAGGFYFTLLEARGSDKALSDPAKYSTADLAAKRLEVEVECETICDRAFVPRYRRVVLDGTGATDLILPDADVRLIRRASMADRADGTFTDLDVDQLAALVYGDNRVLRRVDGDEWTEGRRNIVLEYEYGLDAPPADLVTAAKTRLRHRLNINNSGIAERATSFTLADGGTYRMAMPGAWTTGLPEVDAIYSRYSLRDTDGDGGRSVPASRTLVYEPQRNSLFHQRTGPQ